MLALIPVVIFGLLLYVAPRSAGAIESAKRSELPDA